jgi:NAD(P)-dependent dehydrogenase (short-subunit alcohol dehydrogenase family)
LPGLASLQLTKKRAGSQSVPTLLGCRHRTLEETMSGMMDGKVAVVTGAGGGIGREIALTMAAAGAKVIVADIGASLSGEGGSASPAQQTKQLIEQKGGAAEICTESVAAWGSAQKIIQAALDHFGRIDAVAASSSPAPLLNTIVSRRVAPSST